MQDREAAQTLSPTLSEQRKLSSDFGLKRAVNFEIFASREAPVMTVLQQTKDALSRVIRHKLDWIAAGAI